MAEVVHDRKLRLPRVLVVEDDSAAREMYSYVLNVSGFEVEDARCGQEALGKVAAAVPDIILADIGLPDIDGFALCRRIKKDEHTCQVPVVGITGREWPDVETRVEKAGLGRLLVKPCQPETLVDALETTLVRARTRIRLVAEFLEMPGLHLTLSQAARLCGIEPTTCKALLDELVSSRVLCLKPGGVYAPLTGGPVSRVRTR
jgi:two-component system, cell cycle response regulator DivK